MSYANAARDMQQLMGVKVSHSTQQRLVQRQEFAEVQVETPVAALSVDGGKARLRTPKGQPCEWRDYKAVTLHNQAQAAFFQENDKLLAWVNRQPLRSLLTCLGDGHAGVWNLMTAIGKAEQRREILDWYHLKENLHKVGGSEKRLRKVETLLWHGRVDEAILAFSGWDASQAHNFVAYLKRHRSRIPDYQTMQSQGVAIGSGSVESTIKQIGRRIKLSGAQWNPKNLSQVLKHRCAYLNLAFA